MKIRQINVNTKNRKYPILIGSNLIKNLKNILKNNSINSSKYLLVIDTKVPKKLVELTKKNLDTKAIIYRFVSSEKNKNFNKLNHILNILLKENFNRNDSIIAVGGGIVGDVAAFAASIFKRGLHLINIPTTLLAQVDSSIGGKTGINTKYGKNLIGSFYQPKIVISDVSFLRSLPKRELICGYGEILKHALIKNRKLFNYLSKYLDKIIKLESPFIEKAIYDSCSIKKEVVQKDEEEKNLRKILNFGHTFGHAYEAATGFSKRLNHGEAVILGIKSASEFSFNKKKLSSKEFTLINQHINNLDNSLRVNKFFKNKDLNKIMNFMKSDKKNINKKINLILLNKISKATINNYYSSKEIKNFIKNQINSI